MPAKVREMKSAVCCPCRWNQLDVAIVLLSVTGIILEEMKSGVIPINPTIIRVMRVLRIARGASCVAQPLNLSQS